jgi:hypothetical protein
VASRTSTTATKRKNNMNWKMAVTFAVLAVASTAASAQQSTFRDAQGRTTGTAATTNGGSGVTTTFRDSTGRTTGTATTTNGGATTFRDAGGRTTGTATAPRK